jgi:putative flippase GtrA
VTLIRFAAVGAVGTIVDISVLSLLNVHTPLPLWLANVGSYCCGILSNFLLNRYWTFKHGSSGKAGREFLQFFIVSATGMVLNTLLLMLLEPIFAGAGMGDWSCLPAKAAAAGIVFVWNYVMNRLWTFRGENQACSAVSRAGTR